MDTDRSFGLMIRVTSRATSFLSHFLALSRRTTWILVSTVMTRSVSSCLLVLLFSLASLSDVDAYPKPDYGDDLERELGGSSRPFDRRLAEGNDLAPQRERAMQKIQELLGIRSQNENLAHRKVPPEFMMELYNTIADSDGVTRGRNPYNAKVVRSFIERGDSFDASPSHFYFFNISGLEINESVLEAELHLYRRRTPSRNVRSTTLTSPYYLIRVYQVLEDRNLDLPDLHRLLNVRYVGSHASGWQVFNVKEAVLGWMNGDPNLGLFVTARNLFEDEVSVVFSRRSDYHHSKQPILVLFDDDSGDRGRSGGTLDVAPRYYAYGNEDDDEEEDRGGGKRLVFEETAKDEEVDPRNSYDDVERYRRHKRQREIGQPEEVLLTNRRELEFFQREKRGREEEEEVGERKVSTRHDDPREESGTLTTGAATTRLPRRRRRGAVAASSNKRRPVAGIVSRDRMRFPKSILSSMDIYERALLRERLGQVVRDRPTDDATRRRQRRRRQRRTTQSASGRNATEECTRHELYVDFHDIGLSSSIIAPLGYSAYQCKGVCESPLSQDQRPTNHATIQAIVHKMGLVENVKRPCCVPTKLLSTSFLFYDNNENVVLKMYEDMIADRCGCR